MDDIFNVPLSHYFHLNNSWAMKHLLILFLTMILSSPILFGQQLICVQGDSTEPIFVTDFGAAIDTAKDGDFIYLPGSFSGSGSASSTSSVRINKQLTIIGTGYNMKYNRATGTSKLYCTEISLDSNAKGTRISGIDAQNALLNINASDVVISRCLISSIQFGPKSSKIGISENIIFAQPKLGFSLISAAKPNEVGIQNNVIIGAVYSAKGVTFINNIFLETRIITTSEAIFKNNIFCDYQNTTMGSNYFYNNLLVNSSAVLSSAIDTANNITSYPRDSIFKRWNGQVTWQPDFDFDLQSSCLGINAGTDSTDVGIFGSSTPFKVGGIPENPHIESFYLPNSTTSDGKLNVKIKVQGQEH